MNKNALKGLLKNHSLAMVLCCALPITLVVIMAFTGYLGSWGWVALFLLCPIMHLFMMRGHPSSQHQGNPTPTTDVREDQEVTPKASA